MKPRSPAPPPEHTHQPTHSSNGSSPIDRTLGDRLARLLEGFPLAELDPGGVTSPATLRLLALATFLQHRERLSDPQTVRALQFRPDWQTALQVPHSYPGVDPEVLCEFRQRLRMHPEALAVFDNLLAQIATLGLFGGTPDVRPTAGYLLESVCTVHRMVCVIEAATQIIEALATSHPEWFGTVVLPHWYTRYHPGDARSRVAGGVDDQLKLVQTIGADLTYLLGVIQKSQLQALYQLPEVQTAQYVWRENYEPVANNGLPSQVVWRTAVCARCKQAQKAESQNGCTKSNDRRPPEEAK